MERVGKLRASLLVAIAIAAGLTVTLLLVTRSGSASGGSALVKTANNASLGRTILVTRNGLTLYSLSAERHGRFICTNGACLAIWKPLVVARGVTPTGVKGLTVVRRPDMRRGRSPSAAHRSTASCRTPSRARSRATASRTSASGGRSSTGSTKAPAAPTPSPSNSYGY